jgi:RNA polymerase sigma-70 factor (ECF subfamily)
MAITSDESFEAFFEAEYPGICRALWLGLGDGSELEDAAQEAFARAFRKWSTVSRLDRPATWVYVVAVRQARGRRDRLHRVSVLGYEPPDPIERIVSRLSIVTALDQLAPRQRLAIVLRYYADLSVRDIARAMRCREGTVKATIHVAHDRLRTLLSDDRTTTERDNA